MTLQQKIHAKNSKKGFTLVELVVVIAILAILAAVAIPMVTGYISSATTSARESDASALNSSAKGLMATIASGTMSDTEMSSLGLSVPTTQTGWNSLANSITIDTVLTYAGLESLEDSITDYGYIDGGTSSAEIVYTASVDSVDGTLSTGTVLSTIYGSVS